ncbi:MAG: YybH family protein, partial [Gemmatimonadales bacterium]
MRIALGCAVVALVVGCGREAMPLAEADKSAIRAKTDTFVAHGRARRDSAGAMMYAENGVVMPPNQGIVEGRAAIRAWLEAFPPMADFSLTPVEIEGRGDLAYVRGTYTLTLAPSAGQQAMTDRGKYVEILRRAGGREWLIVVDIFNSD